MRFARSFRQSLQFRVFGQVLLTGLLLLLLLGGQNLWQLRQEANTAFERQQQLVQRMLSVALVEPLWQFNLSQVERILLAQQEIESLQAIALQVRGDTASPRFFQRHAQGSLSAQTRPQSLQADWVRQDLAIEYEGESLAKLELYFSAEPILERTHQQVMALVLRLLLLSVALLLCSYLLIRRYVGRPIQSLTQSFQRAAQSARFEPATDWAQSLPESELRSLAESYAAVYTQLNQYRAELESRVEARTHELQASNESLRAEIEQRIKTESLLTLATAQAERANQEKTQFLARITHELRTPMNGIIGYSQLLQDQLQGRELEYVQSLQRCGHHLVTLINNILDLNRIESGVMELRLQSFDLRALIDDVRIIVLPKALLKQLSFNLDVRVVNYHVLADLEKLRQVLINLLSNAIKYTERGSIGLSVQQFGLKFHFQVTDTGIGIAAQDQRRIFEPFRQASLQPIAESTGLGLAISRALVRHMGGELMLESELHQGSRFYFELSLQLQSQPADSAFLSRQPQALQLDRGYRLWIIDDNPDNRQVTAGQLQRLGFQVALYETAEAALAELKAQALPDLVLMDLQLPGMSGIEATRQLRATYPELPVVAFTASVFVGETEDWDQLFDAVLYKPLEQSSLLQLLHRLLSLPFQLAAGEVAAEVKTEAQTKDWSSAIAQLAESEREQLEQGIRAGQVKILRELGARLEQGSGELAELGALIHQASRQYQLKRLQPLLAYLT